MPSPAMTDRADALAERRVGAVTHEWLGAMPDVVARLESMRHPRIADLGCGHGLSTLALAHPFLDAHVDGLDDDPASITVARRHARDAGLDGRVRFLHADATELAGPYDLIVIHEAFHALARPVDALAAARAALAVDGTVLVVGELDNDFFRLYRLHP
jgi:cyclopropane fatty-acyl-phospholipid synthase-like methyltransferase